MTLNAVQEDLDIQVLDEAGRSCLGVEKVFEV